MKYSGHKILISLAVIAVTIVFHSACKREDDKQQVNGSDVFVLEVPEGFPQPYVSAENPLSRAGVELGRKLYYDSLLSMGGSLQGLSCASCHFQSIGFIRHGLPVLAHVNLAWSRNFLWKGSDNTTLEDIMLFEVNEFFATDLSGIRSDSRYPELYRKAFGSSEITDKRTSFALAQFVSTLVSGNSAYDKYIRKKGNISEEAKRGMDLFFSEKGDCFHCHGNALFTDNDFHNTGLKVKSQADMGRYLVSGMSSDIGKFKTPSLRNVALRDVFMHDGRFKTLEQVIAHYNDGVQHSEYLDPLLDKPPLGLSSGDISDIVAFLQTLTDTSFISNPAYSKPN